MNQPSPTPPASDDPQPAAVLARPATDETVKETIESIVIAFILAFIFRAFIVEAFIIPTGSMAPTLLGAHVSLHCPSCDYRFDASIRGQKQGQIISKGNEVTCPMCWYPVQIEPGSRVRAGDRILVDKFLYTFKDPKRWDVIVFKNPQAINDEDQSPGPRTNYIKRLIGLPGEKLILLDGNIYIADSMGPDKNFHIVRKTDPNENPHWEKVQRSVWQPIYHSQYVPLSDARPWDGHRGDPNRALAHAWSPPWHAEPGDEDKWLLGTAHRPSRNYQFKGGQGSIHFDFQPSSLTPGHPGYNGLPSIFPYNRESLGSRVGMPSRNHLPIEDIRLAVSVIPQGDDAVISLATTARLDLPERGIETLVASIDSKGFVYLTVPMGGITRQLGEEVQGPALKPGVATEIELWLVDDEVSVWVAGEQVLSYRFDLTWEQINQRPSQADLPKVSIAVDSPDPVTLTRVELDRDVYYSEASDSIIGTSYRRSNGTISNLRPIILRTQTESYDEEFFVLGDNTPESRDGRVWNDVNAWVQKRYLGGDFRPGIVPRGLLVGRAFYVYYPAPHPIHPQNKGIIPNFGDMRFIH